jgi:hypothetical protein
MLTQTAPLIAPCQDPFIHEKFTRERTAARKLAAEYLHRFPKDHYRTEIESWRELQSNKHRIYNEAAAGAKRERDLVGRGI